MKYFIMLKRYKKSKAENTGISINGSKEEAISYALGYHRAMNSILQKPVSVVVKNEWGTTIYEKE